MSAGWFDVDREGLAKLAARRNKTFILRELIQNAWDEPTGVITVEIKAPRGKSPFSTIKVTDDSPDGFADLRHAYTLFAPSSKVGDAEKRGRFNLGEKLVLALCEEASVETTTGTVVFGKNGRSHPKRTTTQGSVFSATIMLDEAEREAIVAAARAIIPPLGKTTIVNGDEIPYIEALKRFRHTMQTEVAGPTGRLRLVERETVVSLYEVASGDEAMLYEMGVPVMPTGDRWHINVGQKVPLNMERDNVPAKWLTDLRAAVANETYKMLTVADANSTWARDALGHKDIGPATVERLVELRFGENAVIADPSDPEATAQAASKGYTVVHGGTLSAAEWENVRSSGALQPAGQVFPTPKPFGPDGDNLKRVVKLTDGMVRFVAFAEALGKCALDKRITVVLANDPGWSPLAAFGPAGTLYMNAKALGFRWFDNHASVAQVELLIHEFGHHVDGNHLSERYHDALCNIGAKVARLAFTNPEVFRC